MTRLTRSIVVVASLICLAVFPSIAQERVAPRRAQPQIDPPSLQLEAGPADTEALAPARLARAAPVRRSRLSAARNRTVVTGDGEPEQLGAIVARSFEEQETHATRLARAELVGTAILALPEIDDEVLEFDDSYVIRRSTKIIVVDPRRVAAESQLFRDYIGHQARRARRAQPARRMTRAELDADEQAGLAAFMATEVNDLDPADPIRIAAGEGEDAVLDAIIAGKGTLIVEDTLIIPKRAGLDEGADIRIATIREGVFDLKAREPVTALEIKALAPDPTPAPPLQVEAKAVPPSEPPPRRAVEPLIRSSGKANITAEFLAGVTRAANFQWERKWTYTSGYFRFTAGAGYAFGYRVPVVARAAIEPTEGYIRDYEDKPVVIGASGQVETRNANSGFYGRAGLPESQRKGGRELLLEANVGYGYKFRAFWKTLAYRPYTAIGLSYSQNFRPPMNTNINCSACDFAVDLDPKTTKMSLDLTLIEGNAWIRFAGRTAGELSMNMHTLVDNQQQASFALKNVDTAAGVYPIKLTLGPVPLRQGTTRQVRPYGVRFADLSYKARLVIVPQVKLGLRVGYKKLSLNFTTPWISLNTLRIDTGEMTLKRHDGTRSEYVWNEGKKTYVHLDRPDTGPAFTNTVETPSATPQRATTEEAEETPERARPVLRRLRVRPAEEDEDKDKEEDPPER